MKMKNQNKVTVTGIGNADDSKFIVYRNGHGRFEMYKGTVSTLCAEDSQIPTNKKFAKKIESAANKHPEDEFIYNMWVMSQHAKEEMYKRGYRVWIHSLAENPYDSTLLWGVFGNALLQGTDPDEFPSVALLAESSHTGRVREEIVRRKMDFTDGVDFNNFLENVLVRAQDNWCRRRTIKTRKFSDNKTVAHLKSRYEILHDLELSTIPDICNVRKFFDPDECFNIDLRGIVDLGFNPEDGYIILG